MERALAYGYVKFCQQEKPRIVKSCPYLTETKVKMIMKKKWCQLASDAKQEFQTKKDDRMTCSQGDKFSVYDFTDELEMTRKQTTRPRMADSHGSHKGNGVNSCEVITISSDESDESSNGEGLMHSEKIQSFQRNGDGSKELSVFSHTLTTKCRGKRKLMGRWWTTRLGSMNKRKQKVHAKEDKVDPTAAWRQLWDHEYKEANERNKMTLTNQKPNDVAMAHEMKHSLFEKYNECYQLFSPVMHS